ncbi:sulfide dehydrogenase (flavocytochrome c) flavoprotein subunit [Sphaerotilus hippei]|uniref:Sulfide dehydrogenase (Flavocytochrome c) flavoprotein subunit n=1 Tax=Sphaerotilus hippei TaxID=744406 RepID=A0A318GW32_9BURK|nr:NAD(P)/FAD-dependent oxidoreductase [Sphaerotilus hippei]PXW93416.1 sulfide dehydrogenase (flavocytochrome c) flavoprotein subunit [Sphaerotilus hippei]
MHRRVLIRGAWASGLSALAGCSSLTSRPSGRAHVLVVGGGYGGATAARYLRLFSDRTIDVTMVEPERRFVSCPVSNLVIGGQRGMADLTSPYTGLADRHGVRIVHDLVLRIDPRKKTATLAGGAVIGYDKLVLSPGVDMMWDETPGLRQAHDAGLVLHAWKAGPETLALRRQLEAMPDGGTFVITVPEAPYRCPPGPYERACVVAAYFRKAKPRSKVLILDANPDVTSKAALFKAAWKELHAGMIEYRPQHKVTGVDAKTRTVSLEVQEDVRADVLNVLPVMRAGALAVRTGLANANGRWCQVDFLNFASTLDADIHVIGDSIQIAQGMPKSGHMANAQAKVAAAAIVAELSGLGVNPQPMLSNVCLSFVDDTQAIHVASVHEYRADQRSFVPVPGSGGVSAARSVLEGHHADAWARNIRADMLG